MSDLTLIPLVPAGCTVTVPDVIRDWKYTKNVKIDNIGCPTQIELVLDQDGCAQPAPQLYVRMRGGHCAAYFCLAGQHECDDPILYSSSCQNNSLSTLEAFKLFESLIPLVTMAMALFKAGIPLPLPRRRLVTFSKPRDEKRQRDEEEKEDGEYVEEEGEDKVKVARVEEIAV